MISVRNMHNKKTKIDHSAIMWKGTPQMIL
jgi:hypothetical protein